MFRRHSQLLKRQPFPLTAPIKHIFVRRSKASLNRTTRPGHHRSGKALFLVLISLTAIVGVLGLIFDSGLLVSDSQDLHHATDAAATAAAMDLRLGKSSATAKDTAASYVSGRNGMTNAQITVNIPPLAGSYAGQSGFVEVIATKTYNTRLIHTLGVNPSQTYSVRSVAGCRASTKGAAIVVLDPNPSSLSINAMLPTLPSYPALIGGLEVLGLGTVIVQGAVLVDTTWGGVDEHGAPAGSNSGPPYGISCTPLLALTHLSAQDIRVAGGVDNQTNYGNVSAGQASPLRCGRLPVPDPYISLPVPSQASDSANVSAQSRGGVQVVGIPLIGPTTILQPGVYEWIEVVSGQVVFKPGVYVIRNVNPATGVALNIAGGTVTANGVLFYLTNSAAFDATSGAPDSGDGETQPAQSLPNGATPSVQINAALPGSNYSPLSDPSSPFDGMLIYQRRADRRPIVVVQESLLGNGTLSGTLYAKWGHVLFTGTGTYDVKIVSGTARLVSALGMTLAPHTLLPAAEDVYLVE